MLSEIGQTEKDKYHIISLIYGLKKKRKEKEKPQQQPPHKNQAHRYRKQINGLVVARGGGRGGSEIGEGVKMYHLQL